MRTVKIILVVLLLLFIAIQFVRPVHEKITPVLQADITAVTAVPGNIQSILKNACYDCHSNNTVYPWYYNVQPLGFMLYRHISEGREELNFSEFANYPPRRQASKLEGVIHEVEDGEMPLASYRLIHRNSRLGTEEKQELIFWAEEAKNSLKK